MEGGRDGNIVAYQVAEGRARFRFVSFGLAWLGWLPIRWPMAGPGLVWLGLVARQVAEGRALFGLAWFCLVWFGLAWFGWVWLRLVWLGLVWLDLVDLVKDVILH